MIFNPSSASSTLVQIATGHNPINTSGKTEKSILVALGKCSCKFMWHDTTGQYQEAQLGGGLQKVPQRGTYCAINLEQRNSDIKAALSPPDFDSSAIDRINLYISPPCSGTPLHFDMRWIVVVQLTGSKLWQVGSKQAVEKPVSNVVADELTGEAYHDGEKLALPDKMKFVLLRPGDWLMLPWATWHGTYSHKGSVSATLAFADGLSPILPKSFAVNNAARLVEGPRLLC